MDIDWWKSNVIHLGNIGTGGKYWFQSLSQQLKKIDFAIFERIQSIEIGSDNYLKNSKVLYIRR